MFSANNDVNGFSAIGQEELQDVNGGLELCILTFVVCGVIGTAIGDAINKSK